MRWYVEMVNGDDSLVRKYFDSYEEAHAYGEWVCGVPVLETDAEQNDTEEPVYPVMVPDDTEGFSWHMEQMTKEELIATLEANSMKDDEISEMILDYNSQYITEFGLDVEKYSDSLLIERLRNGSFSPDDVMYFWALLLLFSVAIAIPIGVVRGVLRSY